MGRATSSSGAIGSKHGSCAATCLRQWNEWIEADALLTNLPPTLPGVFFSPGAHLNQAGQRVFTQALAREIAPLLTKPR